MVELIKHNLSRPSSMKMARVELIDLKVENNLNLMMDNYLSVKQEIETRMSDLQSQERIMTLQVWNPQYV